MSIEWKASERPVEYQDAITFMEKRIDGIAAGEQDDCVWLLEHPPIYTAGTSANKKDLIDEQRFPVFETGRGGQYTYHGPGQRIAYTMLNLKKHYKKPDLRAYVHDLEEWIIQSLREFGIEGQRREGRVGIWVASPDGKENKIAALGVRVRKWVSYHGISINLNPNLEHFQGIVPCGIHEHGVTRICDLVPHVTMQELDRVLKEKFTL